MLNEFGGKRPSEGRSCMRSLWRTSGGALCCIAAVLFGAGLGAVHGFSLADPLEHPSPLTLALAYPAVFFAGGHGFGTAPCEDIPGLKDFLSRKVDSFDVSAIPAGIDLAPMTTPLELTHIYFIYAIGVFWRIFGVSVWTLVLFSAFLCGVSALAVYGLFRLGMSRVSALAGVLLVCSSPAMLHLSNNLRDFGKTPFLFGFFYIVVRLFIRPVSVRAFLALVALLGGVLGLGMGFRQDLMICLPFALAVPLLLAKAATPYLWRVRVAATVLFLAVFVPLSWPALRGAALEGNQVSVHSFLMGLSSEIESQIDFGQSSYEQTIYGDNCTYASTNVFARRLGYEGPMVNTVTAEYRYVMGEPNAPRPLDPALYYTGAEHARFGRMLLADMLLDFPADVIARAWRAVAAVYQVPEEMCKEGYWIDASWPGWMERVFRAQELLAAGIKYAGLPTIALLLLLIGARNFRLALFLGILLLWFTGYSSILYQYRHIAYVITIPIGAMMILLEGVVTRAAHLRNNMSKRNSRAGRVGSGRTDRAPGKDRATGDAPCVRPALKMLALTGLVLVALLGPLSILRAWQAVRVDDLADRLESTSREPVECRLAVSDGRAFVSSVNPLPGLADAESLPPGETAWEYLAAVFNTDGTDIPVILEYDHDRVLNDFSLETWVWGSEDTGRGKVTLFFPVYEATTLYSPQLLLAFLETIDIRQWSQEIDPALPIEEQMMWRPSKFLGISFPEQFRDAFVGLYTVDKLESLTYLPIFKLPAKRENIRPYKTGPWERSLCAHMAAIRD